jgi:hypothetical protein
MMENENPLLEVWHKDRKVTVYKDTIIRVWGTDLDNEMSETPNDLDWAQIAFDWLYRVEEQPPPRSP